MDNLIPILTIGGISLLGLLIIGFILARMFVKATAELAFVKTGFGGKKVCKEGGLLILPVLHFTTWVRLSTLKLKVQKIDKEALITNDRMRIDITAEFYMRVKPDADAIAMAAQTLGDRTQDPERLRELMEGKFIDVLRAVAMEMKMEELLEKRSDFVQKVQNSVREDLTKNGLELETVSLTSLDQTDRRHFNEDNANDAIGLAQLTRIVEERKKERNDIEKENAVKIAKKNLEAEKEILSIGKEKEYAKLEQERNIANKTAEEDATRAKIEAEQEQISNEAIVNSEKEIKKAKLEAERILEQERIRKEQAVTETNIEKEKAVDAAKIEKEKTVELADQQRDIEIAEKSKEKSEADKEANEALAKAVEAEEKVATARETEIAERAKAITIIKAEEESGSEAAKVKVLAQAEKEAAKDRAEAVTVEAQAKADAIKIKAEAEKEKYTVDAEGKVKLNEAENKLSDRIIEMRVKLQVVEHLTGIVEASVKPLEKINDFKVINVTGLTGGGSNGVDGAPSGTDSLVKQLLKYRAEGPMIDRILKEAGLGDSLSNVIENAVENLKKKTIDSVPVESSESDDKETIEDEEIELS